MGNSKSWTLFPTARRPQTLLSIWPGGVVEHSFSISPLDEVAAESLACAPCLLGYVECIKY